MVITWRPWLEEAVLVGSAAEVGLAGRFRRRRLEAAGSGFLAAMAGKAERLVAAAGLAGAAEAHG